MKLDPVEKAGCGLLAAGGMIVLVVLGVTLLVSLWPVALLGFAVYLVAKALLPEPKNERVEEPVEIDVDKPSVRTRLEDGATRTAEAVRSRLEDGAARTARKAKGMIGRYWRKGARG